VRHGDRPLSSMMIIVQAKNIKKRYCLRKWFSEMSAIR
jgi:hypothetical protein